MPTTTRLLPLSATTVGVPLLISNAAAPGQLIHHCSSSANDIDRLTLKLHNTTTGPLTFTVYFNTYAGTLGQMVFRDIPAQVSEMIVILGMPLLGNATPTQVLGYGSVASSFLVTGEVIRITQT